MEYKDILWKTQRRGLGKIKVTHKRRYLKVWDNELKRVSADKKTAYRRWLNTKSVQDKINYKRLSSTAKRETRKRKRLSCEKLIHRWNSTEASQGQTQTSETSNQDIRESRNIKCQLVIDKFTSSLKPYGMT
jgi:hypothetical protein